MKLGLLGGSFDPIHHGHLALARAGLAQLEVEAVYLLPTAQPPHKPGRRFAPATARRIMAELAVLEEPRILVSDLEMAAETTYTVATLERVREELPGADLSLLVGSDSLAELPTWRRWRDVLRLAALAVLPRPGWRPDEALAALRAAGGDPGGVTILAGEEVPISATELRRRLAAGEEADELAPRRVLDYARKYRLYDAKPPARGIPPFTHG